MAKIQEEIVVIRLSKLVKDADIHTSLTEDDFTSTLETIVQELLLNSVIVEVEKQ